MAKYLIVGGTGSLGKKLIERLVVHHHVVVYSRDEAKHWTIKNEMAQHAKKLEFFVGDIRNKQRLADCLRQCKPNYVIVAAALKQVDTCELAPDESLATNVIGTQNVIEVVNEAMSVADNFHPQNRIQAVLFVSTDKACSPVNVYGMCKAMSERVVTSQARTGVPSIKYLCVRYGNVLESRGSIIPLFKYQMESSDSLTVTDPNMTRFLMTLDDSVDLITYAIKNGVSGETWIPRLQSMKIGDLAEIFSSISKKPIKYVGVRPGEKQHEDLVNDSESCRTRSTTNHYIIDPAYTPGSNPSFKYSSNDDVMTKQQLLSYLTKLGILNWSLDMFKGRSIEELPITGSSSNGK
jgi:UDP-glucose 4-epimerase